MSDAERRFLHDGIKSLYEKALECDGWGDVRRSTPPDPRSHPPTRAPRRVPFFFAPHRPRSTPRDSQVDAAEDTYRKLNNAVKRDVVGNARDVRLTPFETQQIAKLTAMLSLRTKELRRGDDLGIGPTACRELREYMNAFLLDPKAEFPFDVAPEAVGERPVELQMEELAIASSSYEDAKDHRSPPGWDPSGNGGGGHREPRFIPDGVKDGVGAGGTGTLTEREGGSLMPPPRLRERGDQALVTRILHFGCKDSGEFIDPFVTVTVVDGAGNLVEATQDTPVVNRRDVNKVLFDGIAVHTQTPLHELPDDAAVILEFKHYKPKKRKISTRGWSFFRLGDLDPDEESQTLALEIYAKPRDLRCRKFGLLSVKPLYFHVEAYVRTE